MHMNSESLENFARRCLDFVRDEGHALVTTACVSEIDPIPDNEWPEGMGTFVYCSSPWGKLVWSEESSHWRERFYLVLTPQAGARIDMEVLSMVHLAGLLGEWEKQIDQLKKKFN